MAHWNNGREDDRWFEPSIAPSTRPRRSSTATWGADFGPKQFGDDCKSGSRSRSRHGDDFSMQQSPNSIFSYDWKSTDRLHAPPLRRDTYDDDVGIATADTAARRGFQTMEVRQEDPASPSTRPRMLATASKWAPELIWLAIGYLCLVGMQASDDA
jgi:hypothetical protein